jgi:hypothetical protein
LTAIGTFISSRRNPVSSTVILYSPGSRPANSKVPFVSVVTVRENVFSTPAIVTLAPATTRFCWSRTTPANDAVLP